MSVSSTTTTAAGWFFTDSKKKVGPVTLDEMHHRIREGLLRPEDMVVREGETRWLLASSLPELFPAATVASATPVQPETSDGVAHADRPHVNDAGSSEGTDGVATVGELPATAAAFTQGAHSRTAAPIDTIPGYDILGELGRGGMGVVYRARHVQLDRIVALKMILGGGHASTEQVERFLSEARAVARLQHANIVQIHEIGERDGLPFFSLEFVDGGSLDRQLRGTPLPPREAAALLETLARAMHAAHQRGIVHRDLKPANVLITHDGIPKITDFGLAKQLDADSHQTRSGAVMGTPSYMAPEQAQGRLQDVGPVSDVYALGALLYECLTGRPPFKGVTAMDTIIQVTTEEPVPPSRLQPKVPRDIELICLKCLRKEPGRRYASAQELADELHRFLEGEPLQKTRAVGRGERVWRWCRRRPAWAALIAVSVLASAGFLIGRWVHTRQLESANQNLATANQDLATVNQDLATANQDLATSLANTRREQQRAEENERRTERALYAARMNVAMQAWEAGRTSRVVQLLYAHHPMALRARDDERDPRGFEWFYLWRLCHHADQIFPQHGQIEALAFSPDGRSLAIGGDKPVGLSHASVTVWDLATGKVGRTLPADKERVSALAWSPDGKWLAVGGMDKTTLLFAASDDKPALRLNHAGAIRTLAFSPNGTLLAVGGDGFGRLVAIPQGKLLQEFKAPKTAITGLAFVSESKLVVGANDASARFWDLTAQQLESPFFSVPGRGIGRIAVAPDGGRMALAATELTIIDLATQKPLHVLKGHGKLAVAVAFSPDGKLLASGGLDDTLRIWDAGDGRQLRVLQGFTHAVHSVAFTRDGQRVAAGTREQVKLWNIHADHERTRVVTPLGASAAAAISPDRRFVVSNYGMKGKKGFRLWEIGAGPTASHWLGGLDIQTVVFSENSRRLGVLGGDGSVRVFEFPSMQLVMDMAAPANQAQRRLHLALSSDAHHLAACSSSELTLHRVPNNAPAWKAAIKSTSERVLAFAPDGTRLALAEDDRVSIWTVADGERLAECAAPRGSITCMTFSPDGRTLAAANRPGFTPSEIHLWDAHDGKGRAILRGHNGEVHALRFAPDGRTLVSFGGSLKDGEVRLWDPVVGQERISLTGFERWAIAGRFSPDGRQLTGLDMNGILITWEADDERDTLIPDETDAFNARMRREVEEAAKKVP